MQEALDRLPTVVMGAVRRLLRPLVRLMIRHGITLPSIVELLKQVMVEVAIQDFPVEGKRTTDSRVSVLTGVHRKDVKRFREQGFQRNDVPKKVSLGMQLVNAWMTEPRWLDDQGRPRVLLRQADGSDRPDFETLSNHISSDVRARAILDELVRVGVVEERDNQVALRTEAFVPRLSEEEKLYYFERSGHAHLMAGVRNLEGIDPPFFDRVVQYHNIPESALPRLRQMVEEQGMALLREINRAAREANDSQASRRQSFLVGLYCYHEPSMDRDD